MSGKRQFSSKGIVAVTAVICTFLWGSAYPAVKSGYALFSIGASDTASKLLFAGVRFVIAGLLVRFFSFIINGKFRPIKKEEFLPVFGLGMVQTMLQYVFFYIGLSNTTGAKGAILNSLSSFAAVMAAPFIFRDEKFTGQKILGCLLGFSGVVLVNLDGSGVGGFRLTGEGFMILSTAFATIAFFLSKSVASKIDVMVTTGYQLLFGGLVLLGLGVSMGGFLNALNIWAFVLLFYMALLSAAAFTLWTWLLSKNPVGEVTIYNLLVPLFGTLLSGLFLGENVLTFVNLTSMILVCLGIGVVNYVKNN